MKGRKINNSNRTSRFPSSGLQQEENFLSEFCMLKLNFFAEQNSVTIINKPFWNNILMHFMCRVSKNLFLLDSIPTEFIIIFVNSHYSVPPIDFQQNFKWLFLYQFSLSERSLHTEILGCLSQIHLLRTNVIKWMEYACFQAVNHPTTAVKCCSGELLNFKSGKVWGIFPKGGGESPILIHKSQTLKRKGGTIS